MEKLMNEKNERIMGHLWELKKDQAGRQAGR